MQGARAEHLVDYQTANIFSQLNLTSLLCAALVEFFTVKIETFHATFSNSIDFSDLVTKPCNLSGYEPLIETARRTFRERLVPLGLPAESLGLPENQEILFGGDGTSAILIRASYPGTLIVGEATLDVLVMSRTEQLPDGARIFKDALGILLNPGSSISADKAERLNGILGKPSPHGKMLGSPVYRGAIRRLYNDELRRDLSAIVNAIGDAPVPHKYLSQMEAFKDRGHALNSIIKDDTLVHKQLVIACTNCEIRQIAFSTRSQAENALTHAGSKCLNCTAGTLEIEENYSLTDKHREGIRQGLWLESLASDVVGERALNVWTGQMVENDEVDVLSVYLDKTLLIECTDSTFGQNDLYRTAIKAQTLDVDVVIVITTREIHPNVRSDVDRLGKTMGRSRRYLLISQGSCDGIRAELTSELDRTQTEYINSWFNRDVFALSTSSGGVWAWTSE